MGQCSETHSLYKVIAFLCLCRLVGDVLQLTGFLSYCGPFNQSFRDMLLKDIWKSELCRRKIPFTENLNLISMLVDQPTVRAYILIHTHPPQPDRRSCP